MSKKASVESRNVWNIHVVRIDGLRTAELESVKVPTHRMSSIDLQIFLKALMARHSTQNAEELLCDFVNNRRGYPKGIEKWQIRTFFDVEKKSQGYWCGEAPLFAYASQTVTEREVEFVKKIRAENRIAQ